MGKLIGALNVNDSDREFVNTVGQRVVYDAIQQLVAQYNAELNLAKSVFVEATTTDHMERYKLPGGGRLQRLGNDGKPLFSKRGGSWDVAFPLEGFGDAISGNRVDMAYMSITELDRHIDTVMTADMNTYRFEMLKALLNKTARTFVDSRKGTLTIQPLANGDSVVYPPVVGSESEATENCYVGTNYLPSAISDTNNPCLTVRDKLESHFGTPQGGSDIVMFINNAQTAKITALTEFNRADTRGVIPGVNTDRVTGLPNVPGRILGQTDSGVWVSEWRWIPADYAFAVHYGVPAPLKERVDPVDTGLPSGLNIITTNETDYPITESYWEHRFGLGCANRLNGVALQFVASATYTTPTAYQ
jgi:hypothetical protein